MKIKKVILIFWPLFSFLHSYCSSSTTVKDGNWADPGVWSPARIPVFSDSIIISHKIFFEEDISILPGGFLKIEPEASLCGLKTIKISCNAGFVNDGKLSAQNIILDGSGENTGEVYVSEFLQVNSCGNMFSFGSITVGLEYNCNEIGKDTSPDLPEIPNLIPDTLLVSDSSSGNLNLKVFPNPFVNEFEVSGRIPENEFVTVSVYDAIGKLAAVFYNQKHPKGDFHNFISTRNIALGNGIYYLRFTSGENLILRKIIKSE